MGCCHSNSTSSSLELGNVEKESTSAASPPKKRVMEYDSAELGKKINDHTEIINWIEKKNLSFLSVDQKEKKEDQKTLIRKILEDAGDGQDVVNRVLDSYVSAPKDVKPQSNMYGVTVDFSGLIREDEKPGAGIQRSTG